MEKEITEVYCGNGRGKTTLAIGQALRASSQGKSVIIIQFLKGNERRELDFLEELDQLDIKIFRFEKMECCYAQLNAEEQAEEHHRLDRRNGAVENLRNRHDEEDLGQDGAAEVDVREERDAEVDHVVAERRF